MCDAKRSILAMVTSVSRGKTNPYFNAEGVMTVNTGQHLDAEYRTIRPIDFRPVTVDLDCDVESVTFGTIDDANAVGFPVIGDITAGTMVLLKVDREGSVEAWDVAPDGAIEAFRVREAELAAVI